MDQQKGDARQRFVEGQLWMRCPYRDVQLKDRMDKPHRSRQPMRIEFCRHPEQPQGVYGAGGCKKEECPYPDVWEELTA